MIDFILNILSYTQILIDKNYFSAIIIYFLFCLFFFLFSLPGSLFVILSSGFFFGFYVGFLINIISITLGSLFFSIISKHIFINYFKNYLLKYTHKLNKIIKKSSFEYLILIRLIFGIPLFAQNLFISTLEISKVKFIISSIIGFTPYFLIFTYTGDKISNLLEIKSFSLNDIFSFELAIVIICFIGFIIFRIFSNNSKNT